MIRKFGLFWLVVLALSGCKIVPNEGTGVDNGAHPSIAVTDETIADVANPVDAQFIDQISQHHQAMISLANQALARSDRQEVRTMAAAIINTKDVELRRLSAWRSEWYPDLAAPTSDAQAVAAISDDASQPFDLRFLDAMIQLNESGVNLAREADGKIQHAQLDTLAESIVNLQSDNVERMRGWQQEWAQTQ